jgi:glutathione S-transferase
MKTPVLYHLEISHYNEKARWALDYKGVPHERRTPPPMLHMAWALALTRRPTFPVLRLNGKAIGDSTRIIEALERSYPEPPLYPANGADRQRALELEDFFDEQLGPHIRRFLFHQALEDLEPREFIEGSMGNAPGPVKAVMRATSPVAKRMLRLRYGISSDEASASGGKVEAAIDRLEQELQPSGYLVGDRFTVADLTAAALLFPLVRPPEAPYMFQFEGPMPESFQRLRDSLAGRPGFTWVESVYRRHRGASAEIAA